MFRLAGQKQNLEYELLKFEGGNLSRRPSYSDALYFFREACRNDPLSLQHTIRSTTVQADNYRSVKTVTEDIPRFLTLEESVEALLEIRRNMRSRDPAPAALRSLISTCTGIIKKKDSTNYKIIPLCKELCDPPLLDCSWHGIPANYDDVSGHEFESGNDNRDRMSKAYILALNNNLALCERWNKLLFEKCQDLRGWHRYHGYLHSEMFYDERIFPLALDVKDGNIYPMEGISAIRIKQKA